VAPCGVADATAGVLAATMPAALLLTDARRRVVWANPAARAQVRLAPSAPVGLESCGRIGGVLAEITEALQQAPAEHEWWQRITVPPATTLQLVARRVVPEHCALLLRADFAPPAVASKILIREFGLSASEARLALRLHRGLAAPVIAATFGVGVGAIRMRLLRLRRRLERPHLHEVFVAIDDVLVDLPPTPVSARADRVLGGVDGAPPEERPAPSAVVSFLEEIGLGLASCAADGRVVWANRSGWELLGRGAGAAAGPGRLARLETAVRRFAAATASVGASALAQLEMEPSSVRARFWLAGPGLVGVELQAVRLPASELGSRIRARLPFDREHTRVAELVAEGLAPPQISRALGIGLGRTRGICTALGHHVGVHDAASLAYALRRLAGAPVARPSRAWSQPPPESAAAAATGPAARTARGVRAVALGREVSNRVALVLLAVCRRRGLAPTTLLDGLGLSEARLRDAGGRHGWEQFVTLLDRIGEALGGQLALAECIAEMILSNDVLYVLAGVLASPAQTYAFGVEHVLRSQVRNLGLRFEVQRDRRLRLELGFPAGYRVSPTCWHAVSGALRVVPRLWREPDAHVEIAASARRAVFIVTLPGEAISTGRDLAAVSPWLSGVLGGVGSPAGPPVPGEAALQVALALDGSGNVECARLLGARLASSADLVELAAELRTVLREQFLARRATLWGPGPAGHAPQRLWSMGNGAPGGELPGEPLRAGEVEVGRLEVEPVVSGAPLFQALLPWIAVGLDRVTRSPRADQTRAASVPRAIAVPPEGLTRRQRDVLERVVKGLSNRDVAAALGCSVRAVESHLTRLFCLLGVGSRAALIARVLRDGGRS
jgi:DNA-binding NarL/FixJ family response regulator